MGTRCPSCERSPWPGCFCMSDDDGDVASPAAFPVSDKPTGKWTVTTDSYQDGHLVHEAEESPRYPDAELIHVRSRQDCDDLIALLTELRERLP